VLSEWQGCRPSLPDSLPVLGRAPRWRNLFLAFGHQHIGLTLGPLTGMIVADLVAGRDPRIDLAPYGAVRRFF
jgi:D-amino-acid dehydrogenase